MSNQELAREVSKGLIDVNLYGAVDTVQQSYKSTYPVIGVGLWHGDRADELLDMIEGGEQFIDCSVSEMDEDDVLTLKCILSSESGRRAQMKLLDAQCLNYVTRLKEIVGLRHEVCVIYASMWCPESLVTVVRFLKGIDERYDINNLEVLNDLFAEKFSSYTGTSIDPMGKEYKEKAKLIFDYIQTNLVH